MLARVTQPQSDPLGCTFLCRSECAALCAFKGLRVLTSIWCIFSRSVSSKNGLRAGVSRASAMRCWNPLIRVHSTMRALPHWVKVAGGNDTSLRKIKVVPPGYERCGEQRPRALPAEMGTRTARLDGLMHVNTSLSNVTRSRRCREALASPTRGFFGQGFRCDRLPSDLPANMRQQV